MAKATDHHILAVRIERTWHETAERAVDMFRYDRCFPLSNNNGRWLILMQPSVKGLAGGFTVARWNSFGFNHTVACSTSEYVLPYEMRLQLEAEDKMVAVGGMKLPRHVEVRLAK